MAAAGIPIPVWTLVNSSGVPVSGAKVYSWVPSSDGSLTATPRTLYSDANVTTPAANPYTLGTNGGGVLYRRPSDSVTIQVKSADDATTYNTVYYAEGVNGGDLGEGWPDVLGLEAAEAFGWYNVKAYGATGDGTTDDLAAIHTCRDAAGVGATIYFPAGTYLLSSNIRIDDANQTWLFDDNAVLKVQASSTAALMRILAAGTKIRNLTADNNRANAPSGGGIVVSSDGTAVSTSLGPANVEIHFRDIYDCASYGVYAINTPGIIVTAQRMANFTTTPVFIFLSTGSAALEGPKVDLVVDLSGETPATYNHPACIIRGREGGGNRWENVTAKVRSIMPDDPTNSTALALEIKAANNVRADVECKNGSMGLSIAEITVATGTVNAKGFNHYGVEFGGGCVDCHFDGALDGRDSSGGNQCLYPLAFQGASGGGVGFNKNCSFTGPLHGATSSQSILFDNCVDCWFQGVVNCGASNYVAYDDGQGYFSIDGIFNGETGGDLLVYSLNSTGRFAVTGRAKAFDNGGAQLEANTAITIDFISMQVLYEDANGGGIITTLSGGAALGENVTAHGCAGQFFGGSSYRGQILNLKRALYNIEGTGSPEGAVTAGVGSFYQRADGAAETLVYLKNSGTGNTGWVPVNTYLAGQLKGTATNDSAAAGYVGEYISSNVASGSAVSLTTATPKTVTSISLTAGDWDVTGNVAFNPNAATTLDSYGAAIHTTTDALPTAPGSGAYSLIKATFPTPAGTQLMQAGTLRVSVSGTTTIYLIAYGVFGTNSLSAYGFIGARRVR